VGSGGAGGFEGRDPASLGKILYRAEDVVPEPQPWPERAWQIWAEVSI